MQLYASGSGEFDRVERCCAVKPCLVYVGYHKERRPAVLAVENVVDAGKSHRADAGEQGKLSVFLNFHLVDIGSRSRVIVGVHSSHNAAERLAEGCRIKCLAVVWQEAAGFHNFAWDNDIGSITSYVPVRIPRCAQYADRAALVIESRLDGEFVAGLETVFPFLADLHYFTGEFVSDDRRVFGNVIRNPFVVAALMGGLV